MAQMKSDSSSNPNTPSSIKLSPMTLFSHVAGSWFNHSPVTDSPRKIETEADKSPKNNNTPFILDTSAKKNKKKTTGPVYASTSPKRFHSIQLEDPPEGKFSTKTRPSTHNPNTAKPNPLYNADTPYRCIICNNEIPKSEREKHFHGRPHGQTFGMLKDFKMRHVLKVANLPKPDTKLLEVNKNERRCPPCNESMPYHKAKTMQDHLANNAHKLAMEKLWVASRRYMRSAFGLRDDEIPEFPQSLDDTIPQKPRDTGM
jgi:hypothetical protein